MVQYSEALYTDESIDDGRIDIDLDSRLSRTLSKLVKVPALDDDDHAALLTGGKCIVDGCRDVAAGFAAVFGDVADLDCSLVCN